MLGFVAAAVLSASPRNGAVLRRWRVSEGSAGRAPLWVGFGGSRLRPLRDSGFPAEIASSLIGVGPGSRRRPLITPSFDPVAYATGMRSPPVGRYSGGHAGVATDVVGLCPPATTTSREAAVVSRRPNIQCDPKANHAVRLSIPAQRPDRGQGPEDPITRPSLAPDGPRFERSQSGPPIRRRWGHSLALVEPLRSH